MQKPPYVALTLVALLFLGYLGLGRMIKGGIENFSVAAIGIPVTAADVDISFLFSKAEVEKLVIGNASGGQSKYALKLESMDMDYHLLSLLFDPTITFREIVLEGLEVIFEPGSGPSNLERLYRQWESIRDTRGESKVGRNLVIHRLRVKNIKIRGRLLGMSLEKKLPDITLNHLGSPGFPTYFSAVCLAVLKELLKSLAQEMAQDPRFQAFSNLPQIFEKAAEQTDHGLKQVGDELRSLGQ